jgi:ribosomal protein S10
MSRDIKQVRQGDVLLVKVREPRKRDLATGPDGLPLAGLRVEGERTGHAHVLTGEVYETPDERRVIRLHEPTPITHEEHQALVVPEGWWEVRIQREWWRSPGADRTTPRWD